MMPNLAKDCKIRIVALGGKIYVQAIRPNDPARPVTVASFDHAAPALRLMRQMEAGQ